VNSQPETRRSLLIRLRDSRDDAAWLEFTAIYEPVIYRMTRRRGIQDADAREVVQEVLLSVSSAINRFDLDQSGAFRGWLNRITRNATIDRIRTIASRRETLDASGVARVLDVMAGSQPLEDEFDLDHRRQLFRWAAGEVRRSVGERNWMAFWKSTIEGMSVPDVARELHLNEGAVYVARCRIIKRIRELVHHHINE
jgi:RNA polymerase sigma-70 factor (ECF subfamily)